MAALTAHRQRRTSYDVRAADLHANVNANTTVFIGAIVYLDAVTNTIGLVTNAGANKIMGIAATNYVSTPAASTGKPLVIDLWHLEEMTLAGVTEADIGKIVYATTDNDITLTAAGASRLGILHSIVTSTTVRVRITPQV